MLCLMKLVTFAADQPWDPTFASDVHSWLLMDRQVFNAVRWNHSDIRYRNFLSTFGLLAGHHPGLEIPVKSVISTQSCLTAKRASQQCLVAKLDMIADGATKQDNTATVSDSSSVSELSEHACAHHCGHKAQDIVLGKLYVIGGMQRVFQPQHRIYMQAKVTTHCLSTKCCSTSSLSLSRAS